MTTPDTDALVKALEQIADTIQQPEGDKAVSIAAQALAAHHSRQPDSDPADADRRERIARIVGSWVTYDDRGGPDTEVLHDAFPGDYDARTAAVYALADAIIAELDQ